MRITIDQALTASTKQEFLDTMAAAEAVHDVLESFTPPEALNVLKMVRSNLTAEVRAFRDDAQATAKALLRLHVS